VSPRDDPRRRRTVAVAGAAWVAILLLLVGAAWHVRDVQKHAATDAERTLRAGAARAARSVDVWIADRDADAAILAEVASIHGTDSTTISPAVAGRILRLQMEALQRRGGYLGVWMVDSHAKVLGGLGKKLSDAEKDAATRAMHARATAVGRPEQRDSTVTIGVAKPIIVTEHGVARAEGAVVFRADLNHTVTPAPASIARAASAPIPVIVMQFDGAIDAISACPAPSSRICIQSASDTLARLAIGVANSFQTLAGPDGRQLVAATQRAKTLPWAVYLAVD